MKEIFFPCPICKKRETDLHISLSTYGDQGFVDIEEKMWGRERPLLLLLYWGLIRTLLVLGFTG